jgi:GPI ethanolamine phosphate transferase 2/3 subunit F
LYYYYYYDSMWHRTLVFALLLASMTTMPLAMAIGSPNLARLFTVVYDYAAKHSLAAPSMPLELLLPSCGALLGAWVGAFPVPLDWDRPWQV